jgi:hypothetical protein
LYASLEQITLVKFEDKLAQVPQSSYAALSPNFSQTGAHNCLLIPRNDGPKLRKLVSDSSGPIFESESSELFHFIKELKHSMENAQAGLPRGIILTIIAQNFS